MLFTRYSFRVCPKRDIHSRTLYQMLLQISRDSTPYHAEGSVTHTYSGACIWRWPLTALPQTVTGVEGRGGTHYQRITQIVCAISDDCRCSYGGLQYHSITTKIRRTDDLLSFRVLRVVHVLRRGSYQPSWALYFGTFLVSTRKQI